MEGKNISGEQQVSIATFASHPLVNVSADTVRRWIDQGIIPALRVGPKLIRVPLQAALAKLHQQVEPQRLAWCPLVRPNNAVSREETEDK